MLEASQPASTEVTIFKQAVDRKWLIMSSVATFLLLGLVFALLQPPRFESSATLVIQEPGSIESLGVGGDVRPDRYVADQAAILRSDAVAERAIEILLSDFSDVPSLTTVRSSRTIDSDSGSNVILISYVADDPQLSQAGANALVAAYREAVQLEATQTFDNVLATIDAAIFEVATAIAEIEPDETVTTTTLPAGLSGEYDDALERLAQLQRLPRPTDPEELDALRSELADLLTFLDAVRVVASLETDPVNDTTPDPALEALNDYHDELVGLRNSIALDAEFAGRSSTIFSSAGPGEEVSGSPTQILAIAAVLGLLFGLGLLLVLPAATPVFETAEEAAEALGTTVLADIPELAALDVSLAVVDSPTSAAAAAFRKAATTLHARLHLVRTGLGSEPTPKILPRDEKGRFLPSPHAAEFGAGKSIVVVSAGPKEGRTSMVANLAAAAATQSRRILAVDADFDHPRLTELLNGEGSLGLTDFVQQGAQLVDVIQVVDLGADISLSLIAKGSIPAAPLDFFRSGNARKFFKEAIEDYDLVFVDTPALYVAPYAAAIARYCDEVVVVIPHRSLVEDITGLAEQLKLISSNLVGIVYNRPRFIQ